MEVWLNGKWVAQDDARISAFDAGFQHGVGLFESMRARGGRVVRLAEHLARLCDSAHALRLTTSLRLEPLAEAVESTLARNGLAEARIRLTLTGGDLNLLRRPETSDAAPEGAPHSPTILIAAQPPTQYPEALFERGVQAVVADARVNPLDPAAGHKTLAYWTRLRELQSAGAKGASEALVFSVTNHLAGGCVSNAMVVKDGTLRTPFARGEELPRALPAPVLPGTTRAAVIALAAAAEIACERTQLTIEDVLDADEVFLTNSSWGILPVVAVERVRVGDGAPGPITRRLRAALDASDGDAVDRSTVVNGSPTPSPDPREDLPPA